ncbi:AAA family ATPase [Gluconobacter sp. DsW_056]|uniref:AAA family ATPase n=1 Tax=Gluconobacter sp. DsW_056 TaxID=1511209 RepID=UPI000A39A7AB|nr:AAA family ATPase [Gluconobacter sp. DsW_056]
MENLPLPPNGKSIREDSQTFSQASKPALIQYFGIEGLYGYRSISLTSKNAATILIARNGSGKTTLLGALDAFLRLQFSRLRNLEFREIRCRLSNENEDLVLTHSEIIEFLQIPNEVAFVSLAARSGIEPTDLFNYIIDDYDDKHKIFEYPYDSNISRSLLSSFDYNRKELFTILDRVRFNIYERQSNIWKIFSTIQENLNGYEIVYLPTYRRVELTLRGDPSELYRKRRKPIFEVADGSLFTGEIQFGLSDISERLSYLNHHIIVNSNEEYRKISADIINELLDGSFESDSASYSEVPDQDELQIFFERLRNSRRKEPFPTISLPNLTKINTREGVDTSSSKFLSYFLSKLNSIIKSIKEIEKPVDDFIENCNKYLISSEPSTEIGALPSMRLDGKILKINRSNFRVHVESLPGNRRVALDALSSGEKQMISLFAKMFLYPNKKIVLIDEPELSLSIDWQREILVDVLGAPSCSQVIAITHSPFVFDNDLEPFAGAIQSFEEAGEVNTIYNNEEDIDE